MTGTVLFGVIPGMIAGALIWFVAVRPSQLDNHERQRRSYGLRPHRRLPEDDL